MLSKIDIWYFWNEHWIGSRWRRLFIQSSSFDEWSVCLFWRIFKDDLWFWVCLWLYARNLNISYIPFLSKRNELSQTSLKILFRTMMLQRKLWKQTRILVTLYGKRNTLSLRNEAFFTSKRAEQNADFRDFEYDMCRL